MTDPILTDAEISVVDRLQELLFPMLDAALDVAIDQKLGPPEFLAAATTWLQIFAVTQSKMGSERAALDSLATSIGRINDGLMASLIAEKSQRRTGESVQ